MIEWMVEVEDVDIAGPVDDMKKMKVFTLLHVQRGRSEEERRRVQGTKRWAVQRLRL